MKEDNFVFAFIECIVTFNTKYKYYIYIYTLKPWK